MNSRLLFRTLRLCALPILSLTATLNAADTDSDGLDDSVETNTGVYVSASNTGTNPNNADTDADSVPDGLEVKEKTSPVDLTKFNSFSKGMVIYYPFDGDYRDLSGNTNHGTPQNGGAFSYDRFGNAGKCWSASKSQIVKSARNIGISGNVPCSVSLWFYTELDPVWANGYLLSMGSTQGDGQYGGRMFSPLFCPWNGSTSNFNLDAYYAGAQFSSNPKKQNGKWSHFVVTYENNIDGMRFYLDGATYSGTPFVAPGSFACNWTDSNLWINGTLGQQNGIDGKFDDIRFYNRALTQKEAADLYRSEVPPFQIIQGTYSWNEAKTDALARGGRLAVIDTAAKQAFVESAANGLASVRQYLIGATDEAQEGVWKWVNGSPLAFSNWAIGEPMGSQALQDYAYFTTGGWGSFQFGQWNDETSTTVSGFGYVFERKELGLSLASCDHGSISAGVLGSIYYPGQTATLTATPDPGYVFAGWTGDASGTANPLTFTMDADKTIGATFRLVGTDSKLSNLVLGSGTLAPSFSSGTSTYAASVPNATSSITVTPTLSDTNAKVRVNGTLVASGTASAAIPLAVGSNTITVLVTAEDGSTTSTYTVNVTRISNVATLSALALSNGTLSPTFASATKTYTASVTNATTSMTVTPTVTDSTSTVKVNGTTVGSGSASQSIPLVVGTNTITTLVTAQDGTTTSTYTLTVTRVSTDSTLSNLALSTGILNPTFSSATTSYIASVPNATTSITVTATTNHPGATLKVNGTTVTSGVASPSVALNVGQNTITVLVTAQDGTTTSSYSVNVTRISNVATLSGLALSSGTLSPTFASATKTYTASVSNVTTSMTVTPTVTDSTATVKVNGTTVTSGSASQSIPLVVGPNTITTLVTAQDGTTTSTYTLTVTRAPSAVSSLSALALSEGTLSPAFASGTYTYSASVPNLTTSLQVTTTVTDTTATVKVNGVSVASGSPSSSIPLIVGANTITVQSTAQDGTTKSTYTISVSRAPSAVCSLASLTSNRGPLSPAFDSSTAAYDITVLNAVTSIQVTPTVTDADASVKVNGAAVASGAASSSIPLIEGNNTITILVTAQDGTTTATYTLTAKRLPPSTVCSLSGIQLSSGALSPAFDPGVLAYQATCGNEISSFQITPSPSDPTASITVNGNASGAQGVTLPLSVGINPISIRVTAEDGSTTQTYTLQVTRQPLVFTLMADGHPSCAVADYIASGAADLALGFAPPVGASLPVITQTGLPFITGRFSNLAQGQTIQLAYGGRTYAFVANYHGGTGNDLVLEWPHTLASATGSNNSGQLGDGGTSNTTTPVETNRGGVLKNKSILALAAGSAHSLALRADGSVVSWGYNGVGQLGDGGSTDSNVPVAVNATGVLAGKTVIAIAAGAHFNLALCSDGSVASWGNNALGQLGNGGSGFSNVPVWVSTSGVLAGKTVVAIAAGTNHGLALCSDGTLAAWGANGSGQLGNGGIVTSNVPVLVNRAGVLSGKTIISIAAGSTHSLALCSDGSIAAWGANGFGQLGNGSWTGSTLPVLVQTSGAIAGHTPVSVTAGGNHSLALCSDGFIGAWGYNSSGQLGNGSTTESNVPVAVSTSGILSGRKPVRLAAGQVHSMALCSDGTVAAWGGNNGGQLGDGSTTTRLLPVAMASQGLLAGQPVVQIAAGQGHSLLVTAVSNSAELASLSPDSGELAPAFDPLVTSYAMQAPNTTTTLNLTPVSAANNSSIQVNGVAVTSGQASTSIPLLVGSNTITTLVTAQDGMTTQTYTITITRAPSAVATLSNLETSAGSLSPAFAPGVTSYGVNTSNATTSATVTPTLTDTTAIIRVNSTLVESGTSSASIPLVVGANAVDVRVTAQDGTTIQAYTLTITRAPSAVATLSGLSLSSGTLSPAFSASTTSYTSAVANSVSSIKVTPKLTDTTATVKVNGVPTTSGTASTSIPLIVGTNTINVLVTAQDGTTTKTYTVKVTRAKSSDATLSGLVVKTATLSPAFKPSKTAYSATVPLAVKSVKIKATAANDAAKIKINGTAVASGSLSKALPLDFGENLIKILVTAQDGTTKTYKITITRSTSAKSALADKTLETRSSKVTVEGLRYQQLTVVKPTPGFTCVIEVSPDLVNWSSGDRHTTIVQDDDRVLTVRDNTPVKPGSKRFIRVRP